MYVCHQLVGMCSIHHIIILILKTDEKKWATLRKAYSYRRICGYLQTLGSSIGRLSDGIVSVHKPYLGQGNVLAKVADVYKTPFNGDSFRQTVASHHKLNTELKWQCEVRLCHEQETYRWHYSKEQTNRDGQFITNKATETKTSSLPL